MEIMKDVENTIDLVSKKFNDKISLMGSRSGGIVHLPKQQKNAKTKCYLSELC